jgi:hypothetical protein
MPEEAARVAELLSKYWMCFPCIVDYAHIKPEAVETALTDMRERRLVGVIQGLRRQITVVDCIRECDGCGRRSVVYSLGSSEER